MKKYLVFGLSFLGMIFLTFGGYETVKTINTIQYLDLIREVKRRYGFEHVPDSLTLATIETESSFNPNAIREEPAINDASYGLMQILYGTAKGEGYTGLPLGLLDPEENIRRGTSYQARLFRMYGDWDAVIHAYNEGPGNYNKGKRVPTYYGRVVGRMAKWDILISSQGEISV